MVSGIQAMVRFVLRVTCQPLLGLLFVCGGADFVFAGSYLNVFDFMKQGQSGYVEYSRISSDGRFLAGAQWLPPNYNWQVGVVHHGSMTPIAGPEGSWVYLPDGVSDDGRVAIFTASDGVTSRAYRWENGTSEDLGFLYEGEIQASWTKAMSVDGRVITGNSRGYSELNGWSEAGFIWSHGVMTALQAPVGRSSQSMEINADGSTVVGYVQDNFGQQLRGAVWLNGELSLLPALGSAENFADSVSDDGRTIVGFSQVRPGTYHLVRWADGQIEELSQSEFYWGQRPITRTSADGSLIFAGHWTYPFIVWSEEFGLISLERYLGYHRGLANAMSGYQDWSVYDITPDGRWIVGSAMDENYFGWSYIAYLDPADFAIPEPSTFYLAGMAAVGLLYARRSRVSRVVRRGSF